ncbi:MAG TPA: hypothetical protein VES21_01615 [Nocardioidaceae bacterium]|nr:hypothetical protein [Nocardioidaceae bacterium]
MTFDVVVAFGVFSVGGAWAELVTFDVVVAFGGFCVGGAWAELVTFDVVVVEGGVLLVHDCPSLNGHGVRSLREQWQQNAATVCTVADSLSVRCLTLASRGRTVKVQRCERRCRAKRHRGASSTAAY